MEKTSASSFAYPFLLYSHLHPSLHLSNRLKSPQLLQSSQSFSFAFLLLLLSSNLKSSMLDYLNWRIIQIIIIVSFVAAMSKCGVNAISGVDVCEFRLRMKVQGSLGGQGMEMRGSGVGWGFAREIPLVDEVDDVGKRVERRGSGCLTES